MGFLRIALPEATDRGRVEGQLVDILRVRIARDDAGGRNRGSCQDGDDGELHDGGSKPAKSRCQRRWKTRTKDRRST